MGEIERTTVGDSGVVHEDTNQSARALPLQTSTCDPAVTNDALLENIVGFLETTDLFNASCVSKTWRATVHKCWSRFPEQFGSVAGPAVMGTVELLEQILQHAEVADLMIWRQWVPNPLATLPGEYAVISAITDDSSSTGSSRTALIVRLHPWLSLDKGYLHEERQLTFFFEPQMLLTHTAGIWQNMHVTQPPATEVALHYSIERSIDNDYTEVHGVARNSQGVTIGDILNRINITVEELRKTSELKLPKVTDYTERLGDIEALDSRLRTRFIEKLEFMMMVGTARDCVCCESPWVMDGYSRMAEAAAAVALDAGV
ncbi:hypothetical protein LTS10_007227 [Elasticomyces elasticus]|nr:hypothetical protein LTS10_007227 [Elasticomyces elasticus]